MTDAPNKLSAIVQAFSSQFFPPPKISASEWASGHLVLGPNEGIGRGPLSFRGREWQREIVDCISTPFVEDVACSIGTQNGKTVILLAMYGYVVCCDPSGVLWVLPTGNEAAQFSKDRVMPTAEATPAIAKLIPRKGKERYDWAAKRQVLGGSLFTFAGSNSPAQLAGKPKRRVFLDEMEKFPAESRGGEAGAINLALQRTGAQPMPFRFRCSSPAMSDGPGWQEFIKGDQRRYECGCPGCGKPVILAWSDQTRLTKTGNEAWCRWDKECERDGGTIDFDRVHRSARCECPHCGFHIQDHHKTLLIRGGKWVATAKSAPTFRSYHLPSLYSLSPNRTLGSIAAEFLAMRGTLEGLRGFINGILAEPWDTEEERAKRTEVVLETSQSADPSQWVRIMTVDVQRREPEFWIVVRDWEKGGTGNSKLVAAETCNGVDNLRLRQSHWGVEQMRVGIDVKDGVRREEIVQWIAQTGTIKSFGQGKAVLVGWVPMEGYERDKRWKDSKGNPKVWGYELMPGLTSGAELRKIEFSGEMMMDVLALLRRGPHAASGITWSVPPNMPDAYWQHMDAKVRRESRDPQTGRKVEEWVMRRHKTTQPEHWLDAEVMQIAFSMAAKLLPWGTRPTKATNAN